MKYIHWYPNSSCKILGAPAEGSAERNIECPEYAHWRRGRRQFDVHHEGNNEMTPEVTLFDLEIA